ncbi:MAG: PASTA domain-containing protein [Clostridiales bacterium]|nr:PASTA domain-containing protein [Clostridiales bacterium]
MTGSENLCMNCMCNTAGKTECPHCGFHTAEPQMRHALPYRIILQQRYLVGRAQHGNGAGISYIGYDTVLNIPIELHEFFPQTLCERAENGREVRVLGGSELMYDEYITDFLNYSREIAHLRELSAIVQIYDIFEENHTAYTVSEWDESITLRYFVERSGGSLNWNTARQLFMPVLSALSSLYSAGVSHFGISPDTLRIMKDGRMKLSGFNIAAARKTGTELQPELISGCAAIEQYTAGSALGEFTDVYGFAASLFFALTGTMPQEAPKRRTDSRLLIPTGILRNLPPHVITAMANSLQVDSEKRTRTFERLRAELSAAPTVTAAIEGVQRPAPAAQRDSSKSKESREKKEVPTFVWVILSCVLVLILFIVVGIVWMSFNNINDSSDLAVQSQISASSSDDTSALQQSSNESSESNMIAVPDLTGQNFKDLQASTSAVSSGSADYQVLLSTKQFSDTVPEGCVISQSPAAGTKMARGSDIAVVVSQGAAVRTLPKIAGLTLDKASEAVSAAGFTPSKTEAYSDTVPAGTVIGYDTVKADSQMAYGSQVLIVVSKGPDPNAASSQSDG